MSSRFTALTVTKCLYLLSYFLVDNLIRTLKVQEEALLSNISKKFKTFFRLSRITVPSSIVDPVPVGSGTYYQGANLGQYLT